MTRTDFEYFARLMRSQRRHYRSKREWARAVGGIGDYCAARNPRFNRVLFLTACGIAVPPETVQLAAIIERVRMVTALQARGFTGRAAMAIRGSKP